MVSKFWSHTPQNMYFAVFNFCMWVTISLNCDVLSISGTGPCYDIITAGKYRADNYKKKCQHVSMPWDMLPTNTSLPLVPQWGSGKLEDEGIVIYWHLLMMIFSDLFRRSMISPVLLKQAWWIYTTSNDKKDKKKKQIKSSLCIKLIYRRYI